MSAAPVKYDAAQIAKGELEPLGKRIIAQLQKARDYEAKAHEKAGVELRKADDNWNTVTQLLAEAKAQCNSGGFKAFKKKYCPNLGRSRIYELLAIGSGKKTLEETRAGKRTSVAKSRRKVSATSPPVADTPKIGPEGNSATIAAEKSAEAVAKANAEANAEANADGEPECLKAAREEGRVLPFVVEDIDRDEYLLDRLSALLLELKKLTKKSPDRFAGCAIEPSDLETAADFLRDVAGKIRTRTEVSNINVPLPAIPADLEIPDFPRRG